MKYYLRRIYYRVEMSTTSESVWLAANIKKRGGKITIQRELVCLLLFTEWKEDRGDVLKHVRICIRTRRSQLQILINPKVSTLSWAPIKGRSAGVGAKSPPPPLKIIINPQHTTGSTRQKCARQPVVDIVLLTAAKSFQLISSVSGELNTPVNWFSPYF